MQLIGKSQIRNAVITVSAISLVFAGPSQSANLTSYGEPGPRSDCFIRVDDPHISKYFERRNVRAVKVNAISSCKTGHRNVLLTVILWKRENVLPSRLKTFTTDPLDPKLSKKLVFMKDAAVECINRKVTFYYAFAQSAAFVKGKYQQTPVAYSDQVALACGT
jgi:hypothetical protein